MVERPGIQRIDTMKVICKNILCKGRAFPIDPQQAQQMDRIICPHCGHEGAMPEKATVKGDEVIQQIVRWKDQVLYKNAFKYINTKKLPKTMAEQIGPQQQRPQRKTQRPYIPPKQQQQQPTNKRIKISRNTR
jgi:hypothetical protein